MEATKKGRKLHQSLKLKKMEDGKLPKREEILNVLVKPYNKRMKKKEF
jgi:hypothetical protein